MNTTPTKTETPDELDRLFSEFFKAQLKQPWPKAPVPAGASKTSEPSELVTNRPTETPRSQPARPRRDSTARARFTLAASVALAIGACWFLSDGFQTGDPAQGTQTPGGKSILSGGTAEDKSILPAIQKDKILNGHNGGPKIDPVDPTKFE